MSDTTPSILIVDDEPSLLRMMSVYLGRKGYRVTVAAHAIQARELLAPDPDAFAIVVLDATLAGTNLPELGGEILQGSRNVKVLATSGYPTDVSELESAAPGRVSFLLKPFSPEMLAAAVRRLLGAKEKDVSGE